MVAITGIYAALLTLLFVGLSRNVIITRRRQRIALGTEGDPELLRRARAQGNFAEYAPLAIILMSLAEIQGLMPLLVHALGVSLLMGRSLHAFGLSRSPEDLRFRVAGMALTFAVLVLAAAANLMLSAVALISGGSLHL